MIAKNRQTPGKLGPEKEKQGIGDMFKEKGL